MIDNQEIKRFYQTYPDEIIKKRFESPYPLRRYAHRMQYESILAYVQPKMRVLDAGCGEGVLSIMMARKGAHVIGCDLSKPNVEKCREYAKLMGVDAEFLVADAESLPFPDSSFDLTVSSHVLEHLPDFNKGLDELLRVTKKQAIVAIPTILNPCSLIQVGGGMFWITGPRSFLALVKGKFMMLWSLLAHREGVNEGYAGRDDIPHTFRFPWVMKKKIKQKRYHLVEYEASSICLPFFTRLIPVILFLDKYKKRPLLRNFGYGTTYCIEK